MAELAEVDRVMVDELGITLPQMMENAGRSVAVLVRHLLVAGAEVDVAVSAPPPPETATEAQLTILRRLDVPVAVGETNGGSVDLTVDALLGYGQQGEPRGALAALVRAAAGTPPLALHVPSGLELATGHVHQPAVRAAATLTLAASKRGLGAQPAHGGELYLADISVPSTVLAGAVGTATTSPLGDGPLVRLR